MTKLTLDAYDRSRVTPGIVHFGVGGFHRAHQAMYIDELLRQGEALDWGIVGAGTMPGDVRMRDALHSPNPGSAQYPGCREHVTIGTQGVIMPSPSTSHTERSEEWVDPREIAEYSVLMPNGRLAGRSFASRAEAEAWAKPEHGEEVIALNHICACDA